MSKYIFFLNKLLMKIFRKKKYIIPVKPLKDTSIFEKPSTNFDNSSLTNLLMILSSKLLMRRKISVVSNYGLYLIFSTFL